MSHVKHVWCNPGDGTNVAKVGHIVREAYEVEGENGPETKSGIYVDGGVFAMAYRDPSDWDENGSGLCFWNIVIEEEGSNRGD